MSSPLGGLPQPPLTPPGDGYHFTPPWGGWLTVAQQILLAASSSGTSAQRPAKNLFNGQPYFDTTLGKPVWFNAGAWVDASGAPA